MSWITSLEKEVAQQLLAAVGDVAKYAYHKLVGDDATGEKEAILAAMEKRALEAMVDTLQRTIAEKTAQLEMPIALDKLSTAAQDVVGAFKVSAERKLALFDLLDAEQVEEL